jgi:phage tail sheath protein FI
MKEDAINQRWDFFLAHAGVDTPSAVELYEALSPHARVFLDERSMLPGDPWTHVLPAVLKQSRIIVVLVSPNTRNAWYQDSEIRIGLDLLRDFPDRYRVIALLLDETSSISRSELPYGLEQTVPLSLAKCGGMQQVVQRLLDTLHFDESRLDREEADSITAHAPVSLVDNTTAFIGETGKGPTWPILLTSWDDFTRYFGQPLDPKRTYLPLGVRGFFENGGERAYIARVVAHDTSRAVVRIATEDPQQHLIVAARSVGGQGNRILVRVQRGSRIGVRLSVELTVETDAASLTNDQQDSAQGVLEDFDNLSLTTTGPNPLLRVIDGRSEWISVEWAQPNRCPAMPSTGEWPLTHGADGRASVSDYLGTLQLSPPDRTGLAAITSLEDVGIVCVPDAVHPRLMPNEQEALTRSIVAHCEQHRSFAILSTGTGQGERDVPTAPADSSAAAIYCPWITVPDIAGGASISIPAVGHIAGAYAHHDRQHGVHVSPVGIELKGLLTDSTSVGSVQPIDPRTIDAYIRRGVNVISQDVSNPHRVILASAVTMAIDESWRRIGVRRFFNYVERSLAAGTAWVSTAPYTEATWTQVREEIEAFFLRLWRAGVLSGNTPEEAFFVRCDRSTMTENDVENRRVNVVTGWVLVDRDLKFPEIAVPTALDFQAGQSSQPQ